MKRESPRPMLVTLLTITILGCSIVPFSDRMVTETAEEGGTRLPTMQRPSQTAPLPSPSPSPISMLAPETRWSERAAELSILVEAPSPEGGQAVYLVSPRGQPPRLVFHLEETIEQALPSPDGARVALVTEQPGKLYAQKLELLSMPDGTLTAVGSDSSIQSVAWSPSGRLLGYTEILQAGGTKTSIYDILTEESRVVYSAARPEGLGLSGWVGDNTLLLTHFVGGGLFYDQAALLDINTGAIHTVYEDGSGMTGWIGLSPNGRLAILVEWMSSSTHYADLSLLDLTTGDLTSLIEFAPGGPSFVGIPLWSPGSTQVAFAVREPAAEGAPSPFRVLSLDVTNRALSVVVEVSDPPMRIGPRGWVSDSVLIVSNLGGEMHEQVLYSIQTDGSSQQRIGPGRFLTTIP